MLSVARDPNNYKQSRGCFNVFQAFESKRSVTRTSQMEYIQCKIKINDGVLSTVPITRKVYACPALEGTPKLLLLSEDTSCQLIMHIQ